jgi:hypothetical protein
MIEHLQVDGNANLTRVRNRRGSIVLLERIECHNTRLKRLIIRCLRVAGFLGN